MTTVPQNQSNPQPMFRKLENNRPFLKMAFEGFAGDGKTYTAAKVAIGLHQLIKSATPIAIFDTEKASKALVQLFRQADIQAMVADEHRSLSALNQAIQWCEAGNADILIIDSITHVWEEFIAAYSRERRRTRLEFQDWAVIKPRWKQEFSSPFVNAKVHIIFTGRAGYEYADQRDAETGRREIVKTGIKMKAETETAFEPDLLVLMEKQMQTLGKKKSVSRVATVLKDRTDQIDGCSFSDPSFQEFAPAIKVLLDGTLREIHSTAIPDRFDDPEFRQQEARRQRQKFMAEIEGIFAFMGLGNLTKDRQMKSAILRKVYGVLSVEKLEDVRLEKLGAGLAVLQRFSESYNLYISDCSETQEQPDNLHIAQLLAQEVEFSKS
jgi:hypothetical protein